MDKFYEGHGIRFRYPSDWELSEQEDDRDVAVTVASPETSFWTISLLAGRPDPERVLREVLETFAANTPNSTSIPPRRKSTTPPAKPAICNSCNMN